MEEMLELLDHHNCRINESPFCTGDAHSGDVAICCSQLLDQSFTFLVSALVSSDVNAGDAVGAPNLKDEVLAFPGSYSVQPMRNSELNQWGWGWGVGLQLAMYIGLEILRLKDLEAKLEESTRTEMYMHGPMG